MGLNGLHPDRVGGDLGESGPKLPSVIFEVAPFIRHFPSRQCASGCRA